MAASALTNANIMGFLATAKPDQAKQFYSETLGLEFIEDNGFNLVFSVGRGLLLRVAKVEILTPQTFTAFGWQVADIEAVVGELSKRGVVFEQMGLPWQDASGVCAFPNGDKVAWFTDPDGNNLSLNQIPSAE